MNALWFLPRVMKWGGGGRARGYWSLVFGEKVRGGTAQGSGTGSERLQEPQSTTGFPGHPPTREVY